MGTWARQKRRQKLSWCTIFSAVGDLDMMNYVYLLRCCDGTLYCGWTTDLRKRLDKHNSGSGAKYTRSRLPVELVYYESYENRHEALSREWHIKRMTHEEKMKMIGPSQTGDRPAMDKKKSAHPENSL